MVNRVGSGRGVGTVPALNKTLDHVHHIAQARFFGQPLSVVDAENFHFLVVFQIGEKFGRDEEVLRAVVFASDIHHGIVHHAFRALIHTLGEELLIDIRLVRSRKSVPG